MDNTYQDYLERIAHLTTPATHGSKLEHIVESPKFKATEDGRREPVAFPGYSIITPPGREDRANAEFYQVMADCQTRIAQRLGASLFAIVPPESFHLTLADLIWDGAYEEAGYDPQFDPKLQRCIGEIFEQIQPNLSSPQSPQWQMSGLVVMPRAIAVTLNPTNEAAYDRIIALRRALYQSRALMELGIEQQYNLTAHITLGYFGKATEPLDCQELAQFLDACAQEAMAAAPPFWVKRAELRKFTDMTRYERSPNFPVLSL
ncbi:DUF1868 domain-containing protein [Phormidium yuhuli AB48]|uniref:DUF1868 domain-containing protein n=1 Tax=Phormidium yuhuli AB48 TaxID=2940671 RepID=A0ABY5AQQ7_9CYAN|nr:DUF1868 domain-containing protein [Phormidium yuhuli]USR91177.1 DUF1868 domain-containing protein [Phormidium yuhuli AB48]